MPDRPLTDPRLAECSSSNLDAAQFKPRLFRLLQSLRLDVSYDSARGNSLFYRDENGQAVEILDFVGGYGSLLLGHSHPDLVGEAVRLLTEGRPVHVQGSVRRYAPRLVAELSRRAGGEYRAVFANSGTEAVEAAMKHALLETGGHTFIALEGGFHGKTLGALQLTSNPDHREGFEWPGLRVVRVPVNDSGALEAAFANRPHLAGFVFEPIQGEGGVRPVDAHFAQRAAALCAERGIPLIADECQTGVGRTGAFLGCEGLGVRPDYIILSKALGGGLAKISALLVTRKRYRDEFDLRHTSTYADDDFSCAIALKTLEILDGSALSQVSQIGERILFELRALRTRFPDVIADVRGRGLMIGIEFQRLSTSPSLTLRSLSAQEDIGFVLMGYLWHAHRIRVAPTLSDRWTLRLQPSVLTTAAEIGPLREALEDVCQRLRDQDAVGLVRFMAAPGPFVSSPHPREDGTVFAYNAPAFREQAQRRPRRKVAWLCHLVDNRDLVSLEPAFAEWSPAARERYLNRALSRAVPMVMPGTEIRSKTGDQVWLCPIALPFTSAWARRQLELGYTVAAGEFVQKGVDLASQLGCEVVALGQYTSILTRNGTRENGHGLAITTGNSCALLLAIQALARAQQQRGRRPADGVLAVIGAAGNIGRAAAEILAPGYHETILIGRSTPGSIRRLKELARHLPRTRVGASLRDAERADAVLVATNAVDTPLRSEHLRLEAIVCDVSVPAALAPEIDDQRSDLMILKGGIASLPNGEDLGLPGFPLPTGQTYGCMAEGLLLGLEGTAGSAFTGAITATHLRQLDAMARKHGFALAAVNAHSMLDSEFMEVNRAGA